MIDRDAQWVADAAGGELFGSTEAGPRRAVIDSRAVQEGDLFVGLVGANADGGAFAQQAIKEGAWGALVSPEHAQRIAATSRAPVIAAVDPLKALQRLANAWRHELAAKTVGVTGSTGKTSTKDILATILGAQLTTHANAENLNTEIGVPLTILEAERGTEAMVLEMAMRGAGQIAELAEIAEPDVGLIVNVGPVHLELLGTIENVAAAKAELIRDLRPGATAILPHGETLLDPHRRDDIETLTFGPGGDVHLTNFSNDGIATIAAPGDKTITLELAYSEPHNVANTVAAVAAALALGVTPTGRVDTRFSSLRGEIRELEGGITVVNDCYNANPMSMRAALEHLAESPAGRRVAVLGTMAELGPDSERFHRELGELADELGIDVLITVGEAALPIAAGFDGGEQYAVATPEEAGALLDELAHEGDRVLVKGSRSAGLENVMVALQASRPGSPGSGRGQGDRVG